jgi:hypothetical protein
MADSRAFQCMLTGQLWMRYEDIIEDIITGAQRSNQDLSTIDNLELITAVTMLDTMTPPFEQCVSMAMPQAVGQITAANNAIIEAVHAITDTTTPLDERLTRAGLKMTDASNDLNDLARAAGTAILGTSVAES